MRRWRALALALLVALPATAQAPDSGDGGFASPAGEAAALGDAWRERLTQERGALESARVRVSEAETALGDARQRRRPRGKKLAALREEEAAAREDLAAREAAWPLLLEEARRAGVPPVVLREFEEPAAAPAE